MNSLFDHCGHPIAVSGSESKKEIAMETVQVALSDVLFANQVQAELQNNAGWNVKKAQAPDLAHNGVVILDQQTLDALRFSISRPERIVLVTRNDPGILQQVWSRRIRSVVFDTDGVDVVALAAMGAMMRLQEDSRSAITRNRVDVRREAA
jgi:hypothetical protein